MKGKRGKRERERKRGKGKGREGKREGKEKEKGREKGEKGKMEGKRGRDNLHLHKKKFNKINTRNAFKKILGETFYTTKIQPGSRLKKTFHRNRVFSIYYQESASGITSN